MGEYIIKIRAAVDNVYVHDIKFTNDIEQCAQLQTYDEIEKDVNCTHPELYNEGGEYIASLFRIINNEEKDIGMPVIAFTLKEGVCHWLTNKIKFDNIDKS